MTEKKGIGDFKPLWTTERLATRFVEIFSTVAGKGLVDKVGNAHLRLSGEIIGSYEENRKELYLQMRELQLEIESRPNTQIEKLIESNKALLEAFKRMENHIGEL